MKSKLTSRKWWISCAAFLGSLGTSIAGLRSDNEIVAVVGIVCAMLSAAIYAGCEAAIDRANVAMENATFNTTNYFCGDAEESEAEE